MAVPLEGALAAALLLRQTPARRDVGGYCRRRTSVRRHRESTTTGENRGHRNHDRKNRGRRIPPPQNEGKKNKGRIVVARVVARIVAIRWVNVGWTRIGIARTGVRIATSVGATIGARLTAGVRPGATVSAPGIIVALVNRQKRTLTLGGIDGDRVNEAEAERRLRPDNRGTTARQQDGTDARRSASSRADGGACAPAGGSSNRRAQRGGAADRGGVRSVRSAAGALPQLGENGA